MNKKAPQNVFWRLLSYVKPYLFLTIAALSFLLLTTVIRSIIPLLASYFIDHYVHQVTDGDLLD